MQYVEPGTHMCQIFSDHPAALTEVVDFLKQAIRDNGSAYYFSNGTPREHLFESVVSSGVDSTGVQTHLHVSAITDSYIPDGRFDKDRMLGTLKQSYLNSKSVRPGACHFTGEMDWALDGDIPGIEDLLDYEAEVNHVCKEHPFSAVCQYDATRFEPEFLYRIVQAHPYLLIDGMVIPNPDFRVA